jgi:hypothetical protein
MVRPSGGQLLKGLAEKLPQSKVLREPFEF